MRLTLFGILCLCTTAFADDSHSSGGGVDPKVTRKLESPVISVRKASPEEQRPYNASLPEGGRPNSPKGGLSGDFFNRVPCTWEGQAAKSCSSPWISAIQ